MHYEPDGKSNIPLDNKSFLLLDTGGQYLDGTTDVTRTLSLIHIWFMEDVRERVYQQLVYMFCSRCCSNIYSYCYPLYVYTEILCRGNEWSSKRLNITAV